MGEALDVGCGGRGSHCNRRLLRRGARAASVSN